ncbi:MAG: lactoylglutathione lyase [Lachnospiraceae bacterium]|jgi:lactoylglutathione lyase|nr:lactoylglutathione lyase [Lachnospiraceae bacterium]
MEMKCRFDHYNFNVFNLEKSMEFYEKALGLKEVRRKEAEDGSFIIVYLGDSETDFTLELTWLRDWNRPYSMGDNEVHLCVRVPGDYDEVRRYHRNMGWICYENHNMGLYFISDPDNHWIEILPLKK